METPKCNLLHDLLNSLTVIIGECELMQHQGGAEASARLANIRERATHMTEMIRCHECPSARFEPRKVASSGLSFVR